jgi:acetolactate synthase I/II/III large subunit
MTSEVLDQLLPFYMAPRRRGHIGWGKSQQLEIGLGLIIGARVAARDKFYVSSWAMRHSA